MQVKNRIQTYEIYIEGDLWGQTEDTREKNKIVKQALKEGWNVRVLAIYATIIGNVGVRV